MKKINKSFYMKSFYTTMNIKNIKNITRVKLVSKHCDTNVVIMIFNVVSCYFIIIKRVRIAFVVSNHNSFLIFIQFSSTAFLIFQRKKKFIDYRVDMSTLPDRRISNLISVLMSVRYRWRIDSIRRSNI